MASGHLRRRRHTSDRVRVCARHSTSPTDIMRRRWMRHAIAVILERESAASAGMVKPVCREFEVLLHLAALSAQGRWYLVDDFQPNGHESVCRSVDGPYERLQLVTFDSVFWNDPQGGLARSVLHEAELPREAVVRIQDRRGDQ